MSRMSRMVVTPSTGSCSSTETMIASSGRTSAGGAPVERARVRYRHRDGAHLQWRGAPTDCSLIVPVLEKKFEPSLANKDITKK
jgi:hypothetical protein